MKMVTAIQHYALDNRQYAVLDALVHRRDDLPILTALFNTYKDNLDTLENAKDFLEMTYAQQTQFKVLKRVSALLNAENFFIRNIAHLFYSLFFPSLPREVYELHLNNAQVI